MQFDKNRKQDTEQEKLEKKFHLFCVLGYHFAWCKRYEVKHPNGMMNSKVFTEEILPALKSVLIERGGEWTIYLDRDSAHVSKTTTSYMEREGFNYIIGCTKSPDLSKIVCWFVNGYQSGCSFSCLFTVLLGYL
jgi:hypothetical protein